MKPPYKITPKILELMSSISEKVGEIKAVHLHKPANELRRKNQIKSIQSSLQIEGNTLTIAQVTDLIGNKQIIAPQKDITEVKNAIKVYSKLNDFNVYQLKSLCYAHELMMNGLVENPGKLRSKSVGIAKGANITHIAPPGNRVYPLMKYLFEYLKNEDDLLLIKSCVFHYEFEFIHPFLDGNGRIGRLWQTMILKNYSPVFEFLPIEILIKERQKGYYNALIKSDNSGNSTPFLEFMLEIIDDALEALLKTQNVSVTHRDRIAIFKTVIGNQYFTRQDYHRHNKGISLATASRDLKATVGNKLLAKTGDKRLTKYKFK